MIKISNVEFLKAGSGFSVGMSDMLTVQKKKKKTSTGHEDLIAFINVL